MLPYFAATTTKVIGNSTTEATAFATGAGSLTFPAGFWVVGKSIIVEGDIQFSTAIVIPSLTVRLKINGSNVASSAIGNLLGSASNSPGHFRARVTCRSVGGAGVLVVSGSMDYATSSSTRGFADMVGTATLDTTATSTIDVTAAWGTASSSNTLTVVNAVVAPN